MSNSITPTLSTAQSSSSSSIENLAYQQKQSSSNELANLEQITTNEFK